MTAGAFPRAAGATGNAPGKNPPLLYIPCHRILRSNGIGGFTGGISVKKYLLRHVGYSAIPADKEESV